MDLKKCFVNLMSQIHQVNNYKMEVTDSVIYLCMTAALATGLFIGYSAGEKEAENFYRPKMEKLMEIVEEGNNITNKLVDENLHLNEMIREKEERGTK